MPTELPAMGATIAVLGATGCVGRHVSDALAARGDRVLAVARQPADQVAQHRFVSFDVAGDDPVKLAEIFEAEQIQAVVNTTGGWGRTEEEMNYSHIHLIDRLLEALVLTKRPPRLVHVGSIHEYGEVPAGTSIGENTPTHPSTMYAQTKLAGSEAILRAARAGLLEATVIRAVNVCGPDTTPASFLGAVTQQLRTAVAGAPVRLTIADARRDFVDVRDLADAVVRAIRCPVPGGVVNIGRGEAVSLRKLVHLLIAASGLPPSAVEELDAPVVSKGGGWTLADPRIARTVLGWQPRISLEESIEAMWKSAA